MSTSQIWPDDFKDERFAYLTTIGRNTGKSHRIEIWFAAEEGRVYLLSGGRDLSDWVKNVLENPVVTFEIGEEKRGGVAHLLKPNTASDARARDLLVAKYGQDRDLTEWGKNSLGIVIMFTANRQAD